MKTLNNTLYNLIKVKYEGFEFYESFDEVIKFAKEEVQK